MKLKTLLFGLGAILVLWILFPFLFVVVNRIMALPQFNLGGLIQAGGLLLIIFGIVISQIANLTFKLKGDGTPMLTEPPKKLVVKGIYKYSRNPIYISNLLIYFGLFLFYGYLTLLILFLVGIVGFNLYLTLIEEPKLRQRYGRDYEAYMKQVPRWLLL